MVQSLMDPCLFLKKEKAELVGIIGTLVDDSLGIGNSAFGDEDESKSKRLDVKPREEFPFRFTGCDISSESGMVKLHQTKYAQSLKKLSPSSFTAQEFAHLRGLLAYYPRARTSPS